MKKLLFAFGLFFITLTYINAQELLHDPQAKKILENFTVKMKKSYPVKAEFTYAMKSLQNNENFSNQGSIVIDDNKYVLKVMDSEIFSDGKTVWNYLPNVKEVNVSEADPTSDDAYLNNPSQLFQLYNKNFKYRYLGKKSLGGKTLNEIDMYPYDLEKPISRIKLLIEDQTLLLKSVQVFYKSGDVYSLEIKSFTPNLSLVPAFFVFNVKDHPGVEVVDMRF